jgi:hypothetical protein
MTSLVLRRSSNAFALLVLFVSPACGASNGTIPEGQPFDDIAGFSGVPVMNPGFNCMLCHSADGGASAKQWTVAGTVFPSANSPTNAGLQGAQILVTDKFGTQLTLTSNAAGNFYTDQPLGPLTDIEVQNGGQRLVMQLGVVSNDAGLLIPLGSCNFCHTLSPSAAPGGPLGIVGAPGRLFVPAP